MDFSYIQLEKEQKELFIKVVETVKKIPRDQRMKMINTKTAAGGGWLTIPSRNHGIFEINDIVAGDLEELAGKSLLRLSFNRRGGENYTVSPEGLEYYEWIMKQQGKPIERIEKSTFKYFEFEDFRKNYAAAYDKLKQAEELLWASDSPQNFTAIGHHCREAMQEFADRLYIDVFGKASSEQKSRDKNRIKSVIEEKSAEAGSTVKPFLEALYNYWDSVSDLVQRQEHGAQREGEPINWEDSRRVVFQTANVMYELHRTFTG